MRKKDKAEQIIKFVDNSMSEKLACIHPDMLDFINTKIRKHGWKMVYKDCSKTRCSVLFVYELIEL